MLNFPRTFPGSSGSASSGGGSTSAPVYDNNNPPVRQKDAAGATHPLLNINSTNTLSPNNNWLGTPFGNQLEIGDNPLSVGTNAWGGTAGFIKDEYNCFFRDMSACGALTANHAGAIDMLDFSLATQWNGVTLISGTTGGVLPCLAGTQFAINGTGTDKAVLDIAMGYNLAGDTTVVTGEPASGFIYTRDFQHQNSVAVRMRMYDRQIHPFTPFQSSLRTDTGASIGSYTSTEIHGDPTIGIDLISETASATANLANFNSDGLSLLGGTRINGTKFGYLSNVSSDLQAQLDNKDDAGSTGVALAGGIVSEEDDALYELFYGVNDSTFGGLLLTNVATDTVYFQALFDRIRIPNLPTTSIPGSPIEGDMYYDNTLHAPRWYNGTTWKTVVGA